MIQTLSNHDRDWLDKLIIETENSTKAHIVKAFFKRSDTYVELPWKAFALSASIADFLLFKIHQT